MLSKIRTVLSSLMLVELLKGLALTGRYFFARKITVQFPEEKTPQSPRFRGLHALPFAVREAGRFFRQDRQSRREKLQAGLDNIVGREIGHGQRRIVLLALHVDLAAVDLHDRIASFTRDAHDLRQPPLVYLREGHD
jgi:hypothetical protein